MEQRKPKKGEIYRHYKGGLYEIVAVAKHTETMEDMVIYQDTQDTVSGCVFACPLNVFLSPTDTGKYPDNTPQFCYEPQKDESCSIIEFLELHASAEKIEYLEKIRPYITEQFICLAAQSLDFTENEGTLEDRYHALVQYLKTLERYETKT